MMTQSDLSQDQVQALIEFSPEEVVALQNACLNHAKEILKKQYVRYASDERILFDHEAADAACAFFPRFLKHSDGELAGHPFVLDEWQKQTISMIFGFKWKATGYRVIRKLLLFIARGNGKSTFAAGIALLMLIADGEYGAEVYSVAGDVKQAGAVFDEAKKMVFGSNALQRVTEIFKTTIVCGRLQSNYQVISSKADTKHGQKPHAILFDELHTQKGRELYDTLATGLGKRRQPLLAALTTAGNDFKSLCGEQYEYAKRVADGIVDDIELLPVIFEASEAAAINEPYEWIKANPSIANRPRLLDYLSKEARIAVNIQSYEAAFRRLHMNQWISGIGTWLSVPAWNASAGVVDWKNLPELLKGRTCYGALDISSKYDLTALVLMFPPEVEGEAWHMLARYYLPQDNIRRRVEVDHVEYDVWAREGALTLTEGNVVDQRFIKRDILEMAGRYHIEEIAFDPWNAHQFAIEMQDEGLSFVEHRLGFVAMNEPAKNFESLMISGLLHHGGHPVTRWMVSNVAVSTDPEGNIRPTKKRSNGRIDGVVSAIMALGRATTVKREEPAAAPFILYS